MVEHLHRDFLESRESFGQAVSFWKALCENTLAELGQKDAWEPFLGIHRPGEPQLRQEGPIWSLYNPSINKAIVIEQYPVSSCDIVLHARLDNFGASYFPEPIIMMILSCELSKEAAALARTLIRHWVAQGTSPEDMNRFIRSAGL